MEYRKGDLVLFIFVRQMKFATTLAFIPISRYSIVSSDQNTHYPAPQNLHFPGHSHNAAIISEPPAEPRWSCSPHFVMGICQKIVSGSCEKTCVNDVSEQTSGEPPLHFPSECDGRNKEKNQTWEGGYWRYVMSKLTGQYRKYDGREFQLTLNSTFLLNVQH